MKQLNIITPQQLCDCQLTTYSNLEKGYTVYSQGDSAYDFYYITKGYIGLYHILENGKETLLRLYKDQDYFGYRTLFSSSKIYHCSAKVMINANIIRIRPNDVENFLNHNQKLSNKLVMQIAYELQDAEYRLSSIAFNKSLDRVFNTIRYLTTNYPLYKWTFREIAEYAGCETETAIRLSRELKKTGLLPEAK